MNIRRLCCFTLVSLPLFLSACAHRQRDTVSTAPLAEPVVAGGDSGPPLSGTPSEEPSAKAASNAEPVVPAGHRSKPAGESSHFRLLEHVDKNGAVEKNHAVEEDDPLDEVPMPKVTTPLVPPAPAEEGSTPGASTEASASLAEESSALTLGDLEQIALESNPSLLQLASVIEKARGIHDQVGLSPNPIVGYFGEEVGDDGTAGKQGAFLRQTIVTGDKLELSRDVASWNIQELGWEYQAQKHRVLNDVRLRFYEVLGAQQRLQTAGELLKVAQEGVRIAEQLREAQQASRADVLQATVELNQIQIIERNAQYEYEAAWKRLVTLLGRPDMPIQDVSGTLSEPPSRPWEWGAAYQRLLDESPQLQAAQSRIQGTLSAIERQKVQPIPNVLTQIGVARDYSSGDTVTNLQIGVPLPLFNRNQGTIRLAEADYQRAYRDAERLELQLRDRLAIAFRDYRQAKYQVETYEESILENARENLRLIEDVYKVGQVNILRVLTARRTYFEVSLRYVDALIALRKANVVIDGFVLTGGLTDVPDIGNRALNGLGQRGQTLSGQ